jgi:hypothetical protein
MPERRKRELIEDYLLNEMHKAHHAYKHGNGTLQEYEAALNSFNRFLLEGELPDSWDAEAIPDPAACGR